MFKRVPVNGFPLFPDKRGYQKQKSTFRLVEISEQPFHDFVPEAGYDHELRTAGNLLRLIPPGVIQ